MFNNNSIFFGFRFISLTIVAGPIIVTALTFPPVKALAKPNFILSLTSSPIQKCVASMENGMAPHVFLTSTHESALEVISLEDLKKYAIDLA